MAGHDVELDGSVGMHFVPITFRITGPGVDVNERSEPARLFRLRFIRLLCGIAATETLIGCGPVYRWQHAVRRNVAISQMSGIAKGCRIFQVFIESWMFRKARLFVNNIVVVAKFVADCLKQLLRCVVEAIAFVLSPRAGIGWIVLVERLIVPCGQFVSTPLCGIGKREINDVHGTDAETIASAIIIGPQTRSAPIKEVSQ